MRESFIEKTDGGGWIYGFVWKKPWWEFWAKERKVYHNAVSYEDAKEGLEDLNNFYRSLGVD